MADFKKFAAMIITVIFALALASCEADKYGDIDDTPIPTPGDKTYTLTTEHVRAEVAGSKILDDHKAILLENGSAVSSKNYTATHEVVAGSVAVKRSIAEQLQGTTIEAVNNSFNLGGVATLPVEVKLVACETVYFDVNGKTYCHKSFATWNAIAALGCCNPSAYLLKIGAINGDELYATVIIKDEEELEFPVTIAVSDDDVRTVEYSNATLYTKDMAAVTKTVKVNGTTTETTVIYVPVSFTLDCGALVTTEDLTTLAYGAKAAVVNNQAAIDMNIISFTAIVGMPTTVTFVDESASHTVDFVYTTLDVTSNGDIKTVDNSGKNIDKLNTAYFKLVCDNIDVATGTKQVRQYKEITFWYDGTVDGNEIFDSNIGVKRSAPAGIAIIAGADQTLVATSLELAQTGHTQGNWISTITRTINDVKFTSFTRTDTYAYTNGVNNTVNVTKNDNYVVIYNGYEYAVEMAEVAVNAVAPAAGNVIVDSEYKSKAHTLTYTASRNTVSASDETVITLKKAVVPYTIEGYKLVKADQTDRYDKNRTKWESTPICAWFVSTTDANNSLFVAYNENTGAEMYRENTSGIAMPNEHLAMVHKNGTFVGGSVYIEPNIYTYITFDRSHYTAVSAVSVTTASLRDPYQGSGVYDTEDETTTFALTNGRSLILK